MKRQVLRTFTIACLAIGFTAIGSADDKKAPAADNTKVNKRDRAETAKTADQQAMNSADQEITQNIRKAIMDEKSLSTYAHNVKIITVDGVVTLKGPVRSQEEKKMIAAKAVAVAGSAAKVKNLISIKPE